MRLPPDYEIHDQDRSSRPNISTPAALVLSLFILTVTGIVLGLLALAVATIARAHDAPAGWSYAKNCCSNRDCGQIPADWIKEGRLGVTVTATGELIRWGDARILESPDGMVHWCRPPDNPQPRTICLYLPGKSS